MNTPSTFRSARSCSQRDPVSAQDDALRFPAIEPWQQGRLDVGDGHTLYFEQCGNPAGVPVVFLHGGPGSGCSPRHRRLLDPARFRVVLFDQRGCGRSTPRGECGHNTTTDLIADIERLRAHLGIPRWLVLGGSWGSSLALAYCAAHRDACLGAILRGVFLTGHGDLEWFFETAGDLVPDGWAQFAAVAPRDRRARLKEWLFETVGGADRALALETVRHWMRWEETLGAGVPVSDLPELDDDAAQACLDKYRLQAHYLSNECFLGEAALLDRARAIAGLPVAILHGRLDRVCRPVNAWRLHLALRGSRLQFVDGAGHSPFDAPMAAALAAVGTHFATHGDFAGWGTSPGA